jgi:hypothetical protein
MERELTYTGLPQGRRRRGRDAKHRDPVSAGMRRCGAASVRRGQRRCRQESIRALKIPVAVTCSKTDSFSSAEWCIVRGDLGAPRTVDASQAHPRPQRTLTSRSGRFGRGARSRRAHSSRNCRAQPPARVHQEGPEEVDRRRFASTSIAINGSIAAGALADFPARPEWNSLIEMICLDSSLWTRQRIERGDTVAPLTRSPLRWTPCRLRSRRFA